MLTKLLKYDFKSLFKTLVPLYLIMFLVSVLNRLGIIAIDKLPIFKIPAGFVMILYIIMLVGVPIATYIITIIKFYKNLAKDEGYLMHTLPVSKSSLVLSKLISSVTVMLLSLVVVFIAFMIGTYNAEVVKVIKEILDVIAQSKIGFSIIIAVIAVMISFVSQQIMIYASISLGQKHNTNKGVFSIVYGIVLYNLTQIISAIVIILPMSLNSNLKKYINSDNVPIHIFNNLIWVSIVFTIVMSVGYYILTIKVMDKKLNLE